MIFLTVGSQLPFDRLAAMVEEVAQQIDENIIAQVNRTAIKLRALRSIEFLPPAEFDRLFAAARVVIAHAGVGTIIQAKKLGKPLIVCARRAALGEHRNDHQQATTAQLGGRPGIYVVESSGELLALLRRDRLEAPTNETTDQRQMLENNLRRYIESLRPSNAHAAELRR